MSKAGGLDHKNPLAILALATVAVLGGMVILMAFAVLWLIVTTIGSISLGSAAFFVLVSFLAGFYLTFRLLYVVPDSDWNHPDGPAVYYRDPNSSLIRMDTLYEYIPRARTLPRWMQKVLIIHFEIRLKEFFHRTINRGLVWFGFTGAILGILMVLVHIFR